MSLRRVERTVTARPTSDGAGVRLKRALGTPELESVDPFLLLDEFKSDDANDYIAGFPDHPHRGFETVTYMLAGAMRHHDHAGNVGHLRAGSIQWMTAGRGIIHSEMPEQEDGLMWGFQLWVNLPAADKMCAPRYQDIAPQRVPVVEQGGARVRVLCGSVGDVRGAVDGIVTEPTYLHVELAAAGVFATTLPVDHSACCYVFGGEAAIGEARVGTGQLAVLGPGAELEIGANEGARVLVLAARPLREPVVRYGPFVMNSADQIRQAFRELQAGTFLR